MRDPHIHLSQTKHSSQLCSADLPHEYHLLSRLLNTDWPSESLYFPLPIYLETPGLPIPTQNSDSYDFWWDTWPTCLYLWTQPTKARGAPEFLFPCWLTSLKYWQENHQISSSTISDVPASSQHPAPGTQDLSTQPIFLLTWKMPQSTLAPSIFLSIRLATKEVQTRQHRG